MAMTDTLDPRESALRWFVRTNDPDFGAWEEFTAWLEADPANAEAYHEVAAMDAEMAPLVSAAAARHAPVRRPAVRRFALISGFGAAAAAVLAVVVTPRLAPIEYQTRPGEVRVVSLGERDQLVMNGGTRIAVSGWLRRTVRLEQGQVLVELLAPGASRVSLISGDLRLVDIGTVFEVSRDGRATRVVVSEGAVLADPEGARLQVDAGERLDTSDGAGLLRAAPANISSVGAFQHGQLSYVAEPLANVVADLRRSGLDIAVPEAIKARRFTGTLSIAQVKRDPRSLGPLFGVSIEPSNHGWALQERA